MTGPVTLAGDEVQELQYQYNRWCHAFVCLTIHARFPEGSWNSENLVLTFLVSIFFNEKIVLSIKGCSTQLLETFPPASHPSMNSAGCCPYDMVCSTYITELSMTGLIYLASSYSLFSVQSNYLLTDCFGQRWEISHRQFLCLAKWVARVGEELHFDRRQLSRANRPSWSTLDCPAVTAGSMYAFSKD